MSVSSPLKLSLKLVVVVLHTMTVIYKQLQNHSQSVCHCLFEFLSNNLHLEGVYKVVSRIDCSELVFASQPLWLLLVKSIFLLATKSL